MQQSAERKMPWLKARLRELRKTPSGLADHLHVAAPRIYEMIGGRRLMHADEIPAVASFLEWTVEDVLRHGPRPSRCPAQPAANAVLTGPGLLYLRGERFIGSGR